MNWLLTNQDYRILDFEQKGEIEKLDFESEKITFTGVELLHILETRKIDFFWCVFCGFKGKIPKLKSKDLPYADMNENIWKKPSKFLVKKSVVEIISFDGTSTIFKTKEKSIREKFLGKFTDAKELR